MSEITLFEITVKADGLKDAVADINALGKAAESAEAKAERFVEKLEEKSRLMAEGFTRGEASTLAYAKSLGLSNEQMQRVIKSLETIRNLSKDPFDSAIGSIRSIEAEFKRLTDRQDLVSKGIYLTAQQMREYSKIASEIRAKMEAAGDNFNDPETQARFNVELQKQRDLYLQTAAKVNDLVEQERKRNETLRETQRLQEQIKKEELAAAYASQGYSSRIANQAANLELRGTSQADIQNYLRVAQAREQAARAAREQAAAARTLQEIEGRLATALDKTNSELNERGSATLYNYQKALKTLGIGGEEASARLNKVRTQLAQIADHEMQGRMRDLARAVSVQMGDVAISLASGMNPLVVLLQQGDQIRGAFEQAALSSDKAKQAMVQASTLIAKSLMDTAKAVGTFFLSAIQTAGEAVLKFATHSATAEAALSKMRESVVAVSGEGSLIVKLFDNIGKSLVTATGLIVSGFLVSLAAAVVALKQLSDEQTVVAKANAQFGAAFGASSEEIIKATRSLDQFGITSSKATEVFVEIAKAGNIGKESFEGIAIAAVEAQKYIGIAVQDTVKTFSELLKDPVKILTEFGKQTGFVSQEQINLVENLIATGNHAEAQAVSVAILEKAYGDMTTTAKEGMSDLDRTLIEVKSSLSEVWNSFKNSEAVAAAFKTAWQTVAVIVSEVWYVLKMTGKEIGGVAAQIAAVVRGDFKGAAEIGRMMKQDAAAARAEQDRLVQAILNGTKAQSSFSAEQRQANREAIETSEKQRKAFEEWKRKEEQFSKQTLSRQEYINAAVEKYKQSLQGAPVVQEHLNRVIKVSGEEWDKSHKKANSALQKQKDYYSNLLSQIEEMRINTDFRGEQESFITEAYKKQLSLLNDERFNKLSQAQRERILQELNILDIKQQQAAADKKHQEEVNKAWKETLALVKEVDKAYFDVLDSVDNQSISLKKSSEELAFQKSLIGLSADEQKRFTEERQRSLEITKIQKELEKQILDIENLQGITEKEKQELKVRANQNAQERIRQINEETSIKAAQDYYEQFKKVSDTITDIIATAIFEGGDAGAKKLKDVLKNAFRNFVINVIINPIVNSLTGSLLSLVGGMVGGGSGVLGSLGQATGLLGQGGALGMLGNLSSVYSLLNGGSTAILSGLAYGTAPLSQQSIMLAMQEAGFSNAAIGSVGNIGSMAASIGSGLVGAYLGNMLSGGYSIFGGKSGGAIAPSVGATIGSFFGPLGALAGGALGGVANALFGRKLKDTGIEGAFSGDTFTGRAYEFYKGGLFRRNKTKYKDLDPEVAKYLTNSFLSIKNATKSAVVSLGGAGTDIESAIDKFTYSIKISTKGLSEQEIQQKFAEEFGKYSEQLAKESLINLARSSGQFFDERIEKLGEEVISKDIAKFFLESKNKMLAAIFKNIKNGNNKLQEKSDVKKYIDGLKKKGETYTQLLNRLATSLEAVNSVFADLGHTLQEVSIFGAKAASDIIDAFGNIESFYSITSQYYNKYYSDEEKLANSKRKLSEEFDKLGLKVPESTEAFRKLVESQDLSTEEGRKLFAALMKLSGVFWEVTNVAEEMRKKEEETLNRFAEENKRLQAELLNVVGKTEEARSILRELAIEGLSEVEIAAYDANEALRNTIDTLKQARDLQLKASDILGDPSMKDQLERQDISKENLALYDAIIEAERARDAARKAYDALESSISERKKQLEQEYKAREEQLSEKIDKLKDVVSLLESALENATRTTRRNTLSEQIISRLRLSNILASVRSGANIAGFKDQIANEIDVLSQNSTSFYASREDYLRAQYQTVGLLKNLKDAGFEQLTIEEEQLKAIKSGFEGEIARLDQILSDAKTQLDVALGIHTTTLSINEAVQQFDDAIARVETAITQLGTTLQQSIAASQAAASRPSSGSPSYLDVALNSGIPMAVSAGYIKSPIVNGSYSGIGDSGYRLVNNGNSAILYFPGGGSHQVSGKNADQILRDTYGLVSGGLNGTLIRTRASGGYTPPGLTLVGEEGPELINFSKPGMVYNAKETREMLASDNSELLEEVRKLRTEVTMLRAETRAVVSNTSKTARLLDDVADGGNSLRVQTV